MRRRLFDQIIFMKVIPAGITGLMLLLSTIIYGQQDSVVNESAGVEIKFGVFYNSRLHYLGRVDSLQSSAIFPMAELWLGKEVYISAVPVFINNVVDRFSYAGTVGTIGYRFSDKRNKFSGNIYFVKPFYKDHSQLVQSALKSQLSSSFTYSTKPINLTIGGDLRFSEKTDYGAMAGLDHAFRIEAGNNFILVVNPAAYLYAGTQKFTRTYYKQRNFLIFPAGEEEITENVNRFSILAYEFSIPVVLAKGKFQVIANPSYVILQNLVAEEGQPGLSERGKELFSFTIGTRISF